MSHLRSPLLGLLLTVLSGSVGACSSAPEPEPDPSPADALRARFTDQLVAILAFDSTNPACTADPRGMDHTTLAACAHVNSTSLPNDLVVTKDPTRFSPHETMMLVIEGAGIDARHPWFGIVGLGPAPKTSSSSSGLIHGSALATRPLGIPLLAGAAALVNPGTLLTAVFLLGAAALLLKNGVLVPSNEARPTVGELEGKILGDIVNRPMASSGLDTLKTEAKAARKAESAYMTDNGWMAAAGCIDAKVPQKQLGWGYGATEDAAKNEAYDNAINRNGFYQRAKWNADSYCEILLICQRTGTTLHCEQDDRIWMEKL